MTKSTPVLSGRVVLDATYERIRLVQGFDRSCCKDSGRLTRAGMKVLANRSAGLSVLELFLLKLVAKASEDFMIPIDASRALERVNWRDVTQALEETADAVSNAPDDDWRSVKEVPY